MALNTTFTTGAVLTAAQMNNLPWGVAGSVVRTSGNIVVNTSFSDLTGMSITFTAVAGRVYRACWGVNGIKETSGGYTQVSFTDSANVVYGYSIMYGVGGAFLNLSGVAIISGLTAGNKTFKLRGVAENATSTILAGVTSPSQLIIEDVGAA